MDIFNTNPLTSEDWQNICRQNLAIQKQLTTNLFNNPYGMTPELSEIYIPVSIKAEHSFTCTTEKCFFEEVFQQGKSQLTQGKRIALIGKRGSGKTTRLQKIADFILEQKLGLPIWISWADLTQPTITQYIEEVWIKQTSPSLTIDELTQQKEQIWLLFDGWDEMISRLERHQISALLGEWMQAARVVVTCRLNVWEGDKNAWLFST
ncbi:NACHT domain-containing protein [Ancylothrix sp. C2]|uniref:NACHT domain-containing protein n=1 Tax=Ancylothrix sp. D3o TaxID=2953691 RepID=UPI0021BB620C|nr:NACHT domain-containing protein [Ancylothrix sp. D3o]MCT7952937.1 NACHT domain-containing protein [Ancylothrix sp. D3o]